MATHVVYTAPAAAAAAPAGASWDIVDSEMPT